MCCCTMTPEVHLCRGPSILINLGITASHACMTTCTVSDSRMGKWLQSTEWMGGEGLHAGMCTEAAD